MNNNSLYDLLQSAYRKYHCTETAMIKVHDITTELDNSSIAALIMLDLSAAVDTIDLAILLKRLNYSFWITGTAHRWFESYLTGRTQSVKIEGQASKPKCLCCCVPQGSVLGPKSYCIYWRPIGRIAKRYGLSYHCFADDSQLYIILNSLSAWFNTVSNIQECLKEIQLWMEINMLKMNEDKTELSFLLQGHLRSIQAICLSKLDSVKLHQLRLRKTMVAYGTIILTWINRLLPCVVPATIILEQFQELETSSPLMPVRHLFSHMSVPDWKRYLKRPTRLSYR